MTQAQPFIVLALPRSRTCWLAHYLTVGGQNLIGHDITVECQHIQEFLDSFVNGMLGTVETGAVLAWRLIRHRLPDVKIVTVHRPVSEIATSLASFGIAPDLEELESRAAMLQACSECSGVESLDWRDLDSLDCRKWLVKHLLSSPFDYEWDTQLASLNIQVNMVERSKRLFENQARLAGLRAEVLAETHALPEETLNWMI